MVSFFYAPVDRIAEGGQLIVDTIFGDAEIYSIHEVHKDIPNQEKRFADLPISTVTLSCFVRALLLRTAKLKGAEASPKSLEISNDLLRKLDLLAMSGRLDLFLALLGTCTNHVVEEVMDEQELPTNLRKHQEQLLRNIGGMMYPFISDLLKEPMPIVLKERLLGLQEPASLREIHQWSPKVQAIEPTFLDLQKASEQIKPLLPSQIVEWYCAEQLKLQMHEQRSKEENEHKKKEEDKEQEEKKEKQEKEEKGKEKEKEKEKSNEEEEQSRRQMALLERARANKAFISFCDDWEFDASVVFYSMPHVVEEFLYHCDTDAEILARSLLSTELMRLTETNSAGRTYREPADLRPRQMERREKEEEQRAKKKEKLVERDGSEITAEEASEKRKKENAIFQRQKEAIWPSLVHRFMIQQSFADGALRAPDWFRRANNGMWKLVNIPSIFASFLGTGALYALLGVGSAAVSFVSAPLELLSKAYHREQISVQEVFGVLANSLLGGIPYAHHYYANMLKSYAGRAVNPVPFSELMRDLEPTSSHLAQDSIIFFNVMLNPFPLRHHCLGNALTSIPINFCIFFFFFFFFLPVFQTVSQV